MLTSVGGVQVPHVPRERRCAPPPTTLNTHMCAVMYCTGAVCTVYRTIYVPGLATMHHGGGITQRLLLKFSPSLLSVFNFINQ